MYAANATIHSLLPKEISNVLLAILIIVFNVQLIINAAFAIAPRSLYIKAIVLSVKLLDA
jgi:hypothetical protein